MARAMRLTDAIHAHVGADATRGLPRHRVAQLLEAVGGIATAARPAFSAHLGCAIHGLEGRPELNGQIGTVAKFDETKGRYAVQLEGGAPMLLKQDNLAPLSAGGKAEARALGGVHDVALKPVGVVAGMGTVLAPTATAWRPGRRGGLSAVPDSATHWHWRIWS